MTLSFHEKPEDFNQSMSFLSIYHEELEANFQYYSQLFNKSVYHHPVNSQIVLQGFFHFLKIAKLAGSCSDVMQLMQGISQIEGLMLPVEDTLNLKNGLNYAQFLEAILRIAFLKAAETGKSYASTLEDIFSNQALDIKKRVFADSFLNQVYDNEENNEVFRKYEDLLVALFSYKGIPKNATYIEMEKNTLVQIMKEAAIIRAPEKKKVDKPEEAKKGGKAKKPADEKPEEKKEEQQTPPEQLYQEADALASIDPVNSFEEGMLNYFDMLECLLRVARDYKFKADDEAQLTSLAKRLDFLLGHNLQEKFGELVPTFADEREQLEKTKNYQPRSVVEDDAGDVMDDQ